MPRLPRRAVAIILLGIAVAAPGCTLTPEQQAHLPHTYLEQARAAAAAHDAPGTLTALDEAENAWEGVNTPYGNPMVINDPEVPREIGRARQSVQMGRWGDALYYIDTALTHPSTIIPQ